MANPNGTYFAYHLHKPLTNRFLRVNGKQPQSNFPEDPFEKYGLQALSIQTKIPKLLNQRQMERKFSGKVSEKNQKLLKL